MADFAMAFPIRMFLEFMGLPLHMTGRFLEWERIMVQGNDRAEIAAVIEQLVDLLVDTIAERRNAPGGEDLISRAIAAEYNGRRLDEAELLGHCCNLFLGGLDTITTHCGHIFDWLAHHPVEQDWLRRNPAAVADAVHELTRLQAMVVQER
jgi:cytochrome P450